MTQTRIKICGITNPEDALVAVANGVDAIGLVFYARSPRGVTMEQAQRIVAVVPPFVTVVALFVDELPEVITRIIEGVQVDLIQFHGEESPDFCQQFSRPWVKALRVRPDTNIEEACRSYQGARGVLLDSWKEGVPGGTGNTFDWQLAARQLSLPVVLAGGLHADNVGDAIMRLRPVAVDVSGGVEKSPGLKDAGKIQRFIAAVRAADQQLDGLCND
ncbi:MAG: phosphoribosylanthranilate isomerase [Halioglobus sp.]